MTPRQLLNPVLAAATAFGAIYLVGAFANASFNISTWPEESRNTIAFFGGVFGSVISTIVVAFMAIMDSHR
jgi:hypothetical protein